MGLIKRTQAEPFRRKATTPFRRWIYTFRIPRWIFYPYLISGISLGSIYADLLPVGYTMVYGIARMLNFAMATLLWWRINMSFMATTRFGWHATAYQSYSQWSSVPCLGIVDRAASLTNPLASGTVTGCAHSPAIGGVSYFLQNAALLLWSANPKKFLFCCTF